MLQYANYSIYLEINFLKNKDNKTILFPQIATKYLILLFIVIFYYNN